MFQHLRKHGLRTHIGISYANEDKILMLGFPFSSLISPMVSGKMLMII